MKTNIKRILLIVIALLFTTGCGSLVGNGSAKDDSEKYNVVKTGNEKIDVKSYISYDTRQLILVVTNNTGKLIDEGRVKVTYYDENDNIIDYEFGRFSLLEDKKEKVTSVELPEKKVFEYYVPAKIVIEASIDEEKNGLYVNYLQDFVSTSFDYTINNNGTITVSVDEDDLPELGRIYALVVFYKNGRPLKVNESFFYRQQPSENLEVPTTYQDSEVVPIDYDDVKIYRTNVF